MGNCCAWGDAGQPQLGSWALHTPHRMASLFLMTTDCIVKSSPVGSLAAWHSTQYVAKKPIAQLAQVSSEPSGDDASCVPDASESLESKPVASWLDEPESFEPPADEPAEHADTTRAERASTRKLTDAIL